MRHFALLGLLAASVCLAQEQSPNPQPPSNEADAPPSSTSEKQEITVQSGTRVALTLTNPIHTKLARRGDTVRAVTAFPVAVDEQVAIPMGTYVEGVIDKLVKRGHTGHPELWTHFTRMVFPNGYTVLLESSGTLARNRGLHATSPQASALEIQSANANTVAFGFQQPPPTLTPPPMPPMPGPKAGTMIGVSVGVVAAGIVVGAIVAHHRKADVVFESGSQFEMVLESPVLLDADRATAAVTATVAP